MSDSSDQSVAVHPSGVSGVPRSETTVRIPAEELRSYARPPASVTGGTVTQPRRRNGVRIVPVRSGAA